MTALPVLCPGSDFEAPAESEQRLRRAPRGGHRENGWIFLLLESLEGFDSGNSWKKWLHTQWRVEGGGGGGEGGK